MLIFNVSCARLYARRSVIFELFVNHFDASERKIVWKQAIAMQLIIIYFSIEKNATSFGQLSLSLPLHICFLSNIPVICYLDDMLSRAQRSTRFSNQFMRERENEIPTWIHSTCKMKAREKEVHVGVCWINEINWLSLVKLHKIQKKTHTHRIRSLSSAALGDSLESLGSGQHLNDS